MGSGVALDMIQDLILEYLRKRSATYSRPVPSRDIADALHICWSYARARTRELVERGMVAVRGGPGGGYYLLEPPPHQRGHIGPAGLQPLVRELHAMATELAALADSLTLARLDPAADAPGEDDAAGHYQRAVDAVQRLRRAIWSLRDDRLPAATEAQVVSN